MAVAMPLGATLCLIQMLPRPPCRIDDVIGDSKTLVLGQGLLETMHDLAGPAEGERALFLVFVIGIVEFAEASIVHADRRIGRESQDSAETSNAHPFCAVGIANIPYAIQFGSPFMNFDILFRRDDDSSVDGGHPKVFPAYQWLPIEIDNCGDIRKRESPIRSNDVNLKPKFVASAFGGSIIDEGWLQNYFFSGPNIMRKPQVFQTNFWTMGSEKFIPSKSKLTLISIPQFKIRAPKRPSENSDHDRAESENVVMCDVIPTKREKPRDPFMEGGAGLIAGVLISGLILAYYKAGGIPF